MKRPKPAAISAVSVAPCALSAHRRGSIQRQVERSDQSRLIVPEHKLAVVEVSDRGDQRQAKAGAFFGATRIEAAEPPQRFAAPLFGDSRTAVGDLDREPLAPGNDRD